MSQQNEVQKYVSLDVNGLPVAFFSSDINEQVPEHAVKITDDQWLEFINHEGHRRWEDGQVVEHTPPGPSEEEQWATIRRQRDVLLSACDWTMLPDAPLSPEKKNEWIAYRQALRALTEVESPASVTWPAQPQ